MIISYMVCSKNQGLVELMYFPKTLYKQLFAFYICNPAFNFVVTTHEDILTVK
jgi:hypothetical protein